MRLAAPWFWISSAWIKPFTDWKVSVGPGKESTSMWKIPWKKKKKSESMFGTSSLSEQEYFVGNLRVQLIGIHCSSLLKADAEDDWVHSISYLLCVLFVFFFLLPSSFQATGKDKFPARRNRKATKNVSKTEATCHGPNPPSKQWAEAAQEQNQRSRKWNVGSVAFFVPCKAACFD